jgi:hypothetical protein
VTGAACTVEQVGTRRLLAVGAVVLVATTGAAAAAVRPDAHDRALVKRLSARVTAFRSIAATTNGSSDVLSRCTAFKGDPAKAFAASIAILPAVLIDVVNRFKPELQGMRTQLEAMHADSPLFESWLTAAGGTFDVILRFDNHGKTIDYCKVAQVMLSKTSSRADLQAVLGIDPALVASLFKSDPQGPSAVLTRLRPRMKAFFVAAGLTPKQAAALTSV